MPSFPRLHSNGDSGVLSVASKETTLENAQSHQFKVYSLSLRPFYISTVASFTETCTRQMLHTCWTEHLSFTILA